MSQSCNVYTVMAAKCFHKRHVLSTRVRSVGAVRVQMLRSCLAHRAADFLHPWHTLIFERHVKHTTKFRLTERKHEDTHGHKTMYLYINTGPVWMLPREDKTERKSSEVSDAEPLCVRGHARY
jgi:hypothetical protein